MLLLVIVFPLEAHASTDKAMPRAIYLKTLGNLCQCKLGFTSTSAYYALLEKYL
jgi:hypothetical protein